MREGGFIAEWQLYHFTNAVHHITQAAKILIAWCVGERAGRAFATTAGSWHCKLDPRGRIQKRRARRVEHLHHQLSFAAIG